ncbi:hypothetical protein BU24DRAFT_411516 [Aaosphaeria arxii CBS 175.79]|uniref:Uncharacterized protein n=1 Tax=Aaosphaeria arxii CBS 175.79 TaxID=1450172 RepID=A0A6A5XLX5_9PLEO|nr:uncharacterized protein BU24DRAFT_411516 [Aaosphaeria arxii CBS 175.79]KAF2013811.1 hypothetical protein BU24DRAFT_411516 [Aaosphaeria arxii CBS 175.79]
MKDQSYDAPIDSRDLTKRLNLLQKSASTPNDGDYVSRLPRMSRSGTTSSSDNAFMHRLPAFRKSPTSSTTGSDEVSRLEVIRTIPTSKTHRESVEVAQGQFSKPRVRRRRESNESTKSQKEFQYYGRHANSWLFNDFSITDTVKKGFGKVFSKDDRDN